MRATILTAAAAIVAAGTSSSAFGGFSLNFTRTANVGGSAYDAVVLRILNDGLGTGTQLLAVQLNVQASAGKRVFFYIDDTDFDGTPDQVQLSNVGSAPPSGLPASVGPSLVRLGTAGDTFVVTATPTKAYTVPNPWIGGVNSFSATMTTLIAPAANTSSGTLVARLIVDSFTSLTVGGAVAGDVGGTVTLPETVGPIIPDMAAPTFGAALSATGTNVTLNAGPTSAAATVTVDFQKAYGSRAFTILIPITDDGPLSALAFSTNAGTLAAQGMSGVAAALNGTNVQVTGTLSRTTSDPQNVGPLTITATDAGGHASAYSITFAAVPEPATLACAIGSSLFGLRRRR